MFRSPGRGAVAFAAAFTIALAGASSAQAATFNVVSTEDRADGLIDGTCEAPLVDACTLRAAINEANESAAADTIVLPAGTFRIQGGEGNPWPNDGYWGDLDIRPEGGGVTIKGAGVKRTIVSGGGIDRVFDVGPETALTLDGLTVRDGLATSFWDSEFWGEVTSFRTEAEADPAKPTKAELSAALPSGVTLAAESGCGCGAGGGIRVNESARLDVVDSAVSYNAVGDFGDGGGIANVGGDVSVVRSKIHRNSGGLMGGGIANGGHLDLIDSTLSENLTVLAGGGLSNWGTFEIDGSTINGNLSAIGGGGIGTFGPDFELEGLGAAGMAATLGTVEEDEVNNTITNSTITDNAVRFGHGGAIYNGGDWLDIDASTISDNTAVNFDLWRELVENGILDQELDQSVGRGAAIYSTTRYDQPWWATGEVRFAGTIVSTSTDQGREDNCAHTQAEGSPFESRGHNLDSGTSCEFISDQDEFDEDGGNDIENTDPQLDDLKDNGGPSYTRALLDGSPAIDAGGDRDPDEIRTFTSDQTGPEVDQRGGNRPEPVGSPGDAPDIGAYEANSLADLSVDSLTDAPDAVVVGKPLHLNVVVRNAGPDVIHGVKLANELPAGAVASKPAGCSNDATSCDLGDLAPGETRTFETVVTPSATGAAASKATISAAGITDTDATNDSKSTSTTVEAAPAQQQQQPSNLPPANNPQQPLDNTPQDKDIDLNVKVPNTITLNQFFNGITVEADCGDEACLRKFREHAAINTGATRIAGFNLTVSRMSLGFTAKKNTVKLQPCKSGSTNGKRHKRCLKNLRKAAKKAKPFKVKIVVVAVDKAGNRTAQKAFITVK